MSQDQLQIQRQLRNIQITNAGNVSAFASAADELENVMRGSAHWRAGFATSGKSSGSIAALHRQVITR